MSHALKSFLVLRNVFVDIFNLARLNGVLRYLLYLDTAPLPALRILLVILLTQNLDLRGD